MGLLRLEKVRGRRNEYRYYEIRILDGIFADHILECRWGRIGAVGQSKIFQFEQYDQAVDALRLKCLEKIGRGYKVVDNPDGLGALIPEQSSDRRDNINQHVEELDRLLGDVPGSEHSSFCKIVASLASACRSAYPQRPRREDSFDDSAIFLRDDIDYRIRSRVFKLLDNLVSTVIGDGHAIAPVSLFRDGSNEAAAGVVSRLVPRYLSHYLDMEVSSFFSGDRKLRSFGKALNRGGVHYLGDLVQAPFPQLLALFDGKRDSLREVESRLYGVGLQLHAQATWWRRPEGSKTRDGANHLSLVPGLLPCLPAHPTAQTGRRQSQPPMYDDIVSRNRRSHLQLVTAAPHEEVPRVC